MGVAAAVAGLGVAAIGGGVIAAQGAQSAAKTQAAAANQATQASIAAGQQAQHTLAPYVATGDTATAQLNDIQANPAALSQYGLSGLTFQPTQAQLAATPGYQFDLNQGLQAVQNSNAGAGQGVSGAALKGAANYATGLANNTLSTQQGIFQSNLGNVMGLLQTNQNIGENAAAQSGSQGIQSTSNANQYLTGGAAATAAGQVGVANALSSGLQSASTAPLNYLLYSQLLKQSPTASSVAPSSVNLGALNWTP